MGKNTCKNVVIYRNTSRKFELIFSKDGCPMDITNWIIYFTVKRTMQDSDNDAVIKKDITVHLDPTNGKSLIELVPAETNLLTARNYDYDIKFKDTNDDTGILVHGKFLIREPVTTRG